MTNSTARYILFFSLLSMVNTAGPDVQAAEEVDPMQVQVEPSVDVVETWQLGPCGLSGKREGARLVNASGVCGSMQFFASRLSREPAQADDVVVTGSFGVVSAASATWTDDGLRLVDGTLQAPDWTMKSQMLFIGFSGSNLVLESPGVGEKE
jgi:hypothetical protein